MLKLNDPFKQICVAYVYFKLFPPPPYILGVYPRMTLYIYFAAPCIYSPRSSYEDRRRCFAFVTCSHERQYSCLAKLSLSPDEIRIAARLDGERRTGIDR